jgi:predicted small lipoprotein YifL
MSRPSLLIVIPPLKREVKQLCCFAVATIFLAISACGQRGDLVLPPQGDKQPETEQQAVNP